MDVVCWPSEAAVFWNVRHGFLWLRKKAIRVHAWQVKLEDGGLIPSATAKIKIFINAKLAYERDIPYPQPYGMLTLQVYTMSKSPDLYINPEFRSIMKEFAVRRNPSIEQEVTLDWSKSGPAQAQL